MTDRTPADTLTAAAEKLRAAEFRGAMTATPAVAAILRARLPLAAWLDSEADQLANDDFPGIHAHALAVARQILGDPS